MPAAVGQAGAEVDSLVSGDAHHVDTAPRQADAAVSPSWSNNRPRLASEGITPRGFPARRDSAHDPRPAGLAATPQPCGAAFLIIGASIARPFEFLQRAWANDGDLVGLGTNKDPLIGGQRRHRHLHHPRNPLRRRVKGCRGWLPPGAASTFFLPGIRALPWIAEGQ
jgi:hypothetical protein